MLKFVFAIVVLVGSLATHVSAQAAPLPKPPAFAICSACHNVTKGAPNTLGPNLWGIAGRKAGRAAGYNYSPAMKAANIQWNRNSLGAFIANPKAVIPGNRMAYAGQRNPKATAAIADYLLSLK